jgi:manganese transport protein
LVALAIDHADAPGRDLMGPLVNRPWTTAAASAVAGVIISLNAFLLFETFFG